MFSVTTFLPATAGGWTEIAAISTHTQCAFLPMHMLHEVVLHIQLVVVRDKQKDVSSPSQLSETFALTLLLLYSKQSNNTRHDQQEFLPITVILNPKHAFATGSRNRLAVSCVDRPLPLLTSVKHHNRDPLSWKHFLIFIKSSVVWSHNLNLRPSHCHCRVSIPRRSFFRLRLRLVPCNLLLTCDPWLPRRPSEKPSNDAGQLRRAAHPASPILIPLSHW